MWEFYITLDFLNNFYHINLLSRDNIANICIDDGVLLEDLHVLEIDSFLFLVAGVFIEILETEVLAVIGDVIVLTYNHSLTGLKLGDADLVMVEHALLVLFQFI